LSINELAELFKHEEDTPIRVLPNGELIPVDMEIPLKHARFYKRMSKKKYASIEALVAKHKNWKMKTELDGGITLTPTRRPIRYHVWIGKRGFRTIKDAGKYMDNHPQLFRGASTRRPK
jgi:hypothetical protein